MLNLLRADACHVSRPTALQVGRAVRTLLEDPRYRDLMAEGLLVAVQRLYLPLADDPPTGVMRIPAGVR